MTESKALGTAADPSMRMALVFFCLLLALGFGTVASGWRVRQQSVPAERELQTLVTAHFIRQENNFSLAYPTPVLGRPWSIPAEFPLYQWTAVLVSSLTGHELAATGRAVGLLCFYLALPALFLLLRHSGVPPAASLIGLGLVAGNPFCLGQAAAFQRESMAVMFAAWFVAGIMRALATGCRSWFGWAILAGAAAGVIHVRTLGAFQLLAVGGSGFWLWRNRGAGLSRAAAAGWLAAGLLPWVAVGGWTHFATGIRQLNANTAHLSAIGMHGAGFVGAVASADQMGRQLTLIGAQVVWWPLLLIGAALAITFSERWWRQVIVCTVGFFTMQLLFPMIPEQPLRDAMAGMVCLLLALGLTLAGLFDAALPRWAGPAGLLVFGAVFTAQAFRTVPAPRLASLLDDQLGLALRQAVLSNAYLIAPATPETGLRLPLAAQRRTLNLTPAQAENDAELQVALAAMGKEPLGAVVLNGNTPGSAGLIARVAKQTGLELERVFIYREWTVYLPKPNLRTALDQLMIAGLPEVVVAEEALPNPDFLKGEWKDLAKLWGFQRAIFRGMQPAPVSFFSDFGPSLRGEDGTGEEWYNAHPVTRLRFRLPAGDHRLQMRVMMQPAAFDPALPDGEATDGVELELAAVTEGTRQVLHTELIDPVHNVEDRQPRAVDVQFTLPPDTELEVSFGPGPDGRTNRDWIYLSRLRIN